MNQIYIRGNEVATKEYVDSLGGNSNSVIENIKAPEGKSAISYDKDIRDKMREGETKYFYLENRVVVSDDFNYMLFDAGTIIKVSTSVGGGDATTTDVLKSDDEVYELNFVIFGDGTRNYSVHKVEYITRSDLNSIGPETHDGEGMISWYNTAADGENLTENYGVTPDMVRMVKAGDNISWPSRTMTNATENTICLYQMSYEVYNKDEEDYLEAIDIRIGKVPNETYTYVIVGDNVYKNTY